MINKLFLAYFFILNLIFAQKNISLLDPAAELYLRARNIVGAQVNNFSLQSLGTQYTFNNINQQIAYYPCTDCDDNPPTIRLLGNIDSQINGWSYRFTLPDNFNSDLGVIGHGAFFLYSLENNHNYIYIDLRDERLENISGNGFFDIIDTPDSQIFYNGLNTSSRNDDLFYWKPKSSFSPINIEKNSILQIWSGFGYSS